MRIRIHDEVFALSPPLSFATSRYRPAWRARFRTLCYSSAHVTHHTISCRYYIRTRVLFRSTANTRPFFTRFSSVSFSFVSVLAPRRVFRRLANIAPPPTVSPAWQNTRRRYTRARASTGRWSFLGPFPPHSSLTSSPHRDPIGSDVRVTPRETRIVVKWPKTSPVSVVVNKQKTSLKRTARESLKRTEFSFTNSNWIFPTFKRTFAG